MRMGTFSGSLAFGALAALGATAFLVATRPLLGGSVAWSVYCTAVAVVYLVAIAPDRSRGLRIGCLAGALGLVSLLVAPNSMVAVLGAVLLLGLMRSGFVFRAKPGRALVVELGLLSGGLVLANALADTGSLGPALAMWGFFLVQSVYFLIGGIGTRSGPSPGIDPFQEALSKAIEIMDDPVA